ncbi:MAG: UDP-N-acetylglucosamine--N-acetylmuramyl-(pentapeptide) pyrophosphoryl-undecaprenol N-acetylglucosamine transferase [Arcobacteraceae bacterium]|nr:UDP-N-acetylglucosamine--N-acetylmuramyl-(pentapeptide) pyrophosphoryl-undecaprenol N-acetylglucosamine transferase [Arcobacteraceae bacterium]
MYIVVTGGGTGGHLAVARSLIDELYLRGYKVIFIGSTKGADKDWFENYPKIELKYFLETKGVVNQSFFGKFTSLFKIIKEAFFCKEIMKKYGVKKVISVGGFSAASASFGAILGGLELFIHEQNSVMGNLNKITSKFAKEVFSSYDLNSSIKDYPISEKFFNHQRVRKEIRTIIFLGGSQGATAINNFAIEIAPILKEKNISIIHQTGKNDLEKCKIFYKENNIEATVFDFDKNILNFMDKADFAVSRSGASSLWELCALGIPTLFIPYPYASLNHQYFNAKFLLDSNLCFLKLQNELNSSILDEIFKSDLETISKSLINIIKKDGVKQITDRILED